MAGEDKPDGAERGVRGEKGGRDGYVMQDENNTQPESTPQLESDAQHENNQVLTKDGTQNERNIQPENHAQSQSTAGPGNNAQSETTQRESTPQPTTFHIRKKSSEEVKLQAATPTPSALTPGLKAHPTQTHMGPAHCAAHMFDTPENIDDGWKRDSFVKPEAETPMGSMTVKHIESDTILYNCGTCGVCNSPDRERCKGCEDELGGERW